VTEFIQYYRNTYVTGTKPSGVPKLTETGKIIAKVKAEKEKAKVAVQEGEKTEDEKILLKAGVKSSNYFLYQ
jgi:rRNA processing protein Krr1/Pno1